MELGRGCCTHSQHAQWWWQNSWQLPNLKVVYTIRIYSASKHKNQLTVHEDMVPLPEVLLILEHRQGDGGVILPSPPRRPVHSEVKTVPQHLGSECFVIEDKIVTALGEHTCVMVGIQEDHDIICLALLKEEVVNCLIK